MRKKLHAYMNPFQKWKNRWKLRRVIVALEEQQHASDAVHGFARSLEATEIMSRGLKKNASCTIEIERHELDAFIRYMTSLHDAKLSRIMLARIALACLIVRDEATLKEPPQKIVDEATETTGRTKSSLVSVAGKQLEMDLD